MSRARWPRSVAVLAASYAIAGAALTLAGWAAAIPVLTAWKRDDIAMFPNPAVCILASGLALLLYALGHHTYLPARLLLAALASTIGALTLLQHVVGVDLGIDLLLFAEHGWGQSAAAAPMRMGPPASLSLLLIGLALILLNVGHGARGVAAVLAVVVMAITILALIGHLYGAQAMYTIPRLTGIAMQSATMLCALGIGVVASVTEREPMRTLLEPSAAGKLARRALPTVVLIAVLIGWLRVVIQNQGLVDTASGTAARTLIEVVLLSALLCWAVSMVRAHERALHASQKQVSRQARQLATVLETAAIGIRRVTPDGTIAWANEAELEMLGYAAAEYVGHHAGEFHVERATIDGVLERLARGDKVVEQPAAMRCKDGSIKSVLIDASALRDYGRVVQGYFFTRDVTDRRRAEAEREESSRRKDEFLAILAHELRNPLAPIGHAARYLKLRGNAQPQVERCIDMIERQVAQMARLIDDLLDVSRISRGILELRRERVSGAEIVQAAIDACGHEVEAKGQSLRTTLPANPVQLVADRERLIQVLCNLIGNASKYTPAGGTIAVAVEVKDAVLQISVEDDGIGIPPARLGEIFELFVRLDHALDRQGGLGIGLTLVRQLVVLHGGTIEARSRGVGHGSQFVVQLPVVVGGFSSSEAARGACDAAPLRILLADDNRDAAESLALLLESLGHEVHAVFDGAAAMRDAETLLPHVAVLDIGMPHANGYEVAQHIRAHPWGSGIYLVALTGWGQDADKRRAREAGFDAHLVKPVPHEAIEELLAARGRSTARHKRLP